MVVEVGMVNVQCLSRKLVRNLGDWMAGERLSVEVLCVEFLPLFVPEHGQLLTGGSASVQVAAVWQTQVSRAAGVVSFA